MASPRAHGVPLPNPCQNYFNNKKMVNASLLGAQHLAGAHGDLSVCVSPHPTTVPLGESRALHVLAAPPRCAFVLQRLREQRAQSKASRTGDGRVLPSHALLHRGYTKCSHQSDLLAQQCHPALHHVRHTTHRAGHTPTAPPKQHTFPLEPFMSICPCQTPQKLLTLSTCCDPASVPHGNVPPNKTRTREAVCSECPDQCRLADTPKCQSEEDVSVSETLYSQCTLVS